MASANTESSIVQAGIPLSVEFERNLLSRDELLVYYSLMNHSCKDIHQLLRYVHGYEISIRHIWRLRRKYGVHTRENESDLNLIMEAVSLELNQSGSLLGYRLLWIRLRTKYQLNVRRDTVMMLLNLMDPVGNTYRKRRKLQRRVYRSLENHLVWLRVARTNNDPNVIAKHFTDCVRVVNGCPTIVRADRGTENTNVAVIQTALRHHHSDSFSKEKSFMYGRSTAYQRIEAFWSQLRRRCTNWWIDFLKDLRCNGDYNCSLLSHEEALRFCFGPLIQEELDCLALEWNNHRIRKYKFSEVPCGVPEILYHLPEAVGAEDCKKQVDESILQEAEVSLTTTVVITSLDFVQYANQVMTDFGVGQPKNWNDGLKLYFLLLEDMSTYSS